LHLLETGPAKHGSPLRRTEWNRGVRTARRTLRSGLGTHTGTSVGALGLALLAAFGIVFELLVVEKQLFTSGEDKLFAAISAL
jgi:hypothetical protein